jgi:hypothetical protein
LLLVGISWNFDSNEQKKVEKGEREKKGGKEGREEKRGRKERGRKERGRKGKKRGDRLGQRNLFGGRNLL